MPFAAVRYGASEPLLATIRTGAAVAVLPGGVPALLVVVVVVVVVVEGAGAALLLAVKYQPRPTITIMTATIHIMVEVFMRKFLAK